MEIANQVISSHYSPGEYIVNEGDDANSYFIILKGDIECIKNNKISYN